MSEITFSSMPNYLIFRNTLKLFYRALQSKQGKAKTDLIEQRCSSFIHVHIRFKENNYDDISNYILVDSNVPLPKASDSKQSIRKKLNDYYLIESLVNDQHKNKVEELQRDKRKQENKELFLWECAAEYMLGKENKPQFIDKISEYAKNPGVNFSTERFDASITFFVKSSNSKNDSGEFLVQSVEIGVYKPCEYVYSFVKDANLDRFFNPILANGDFYEILGLNKREAKITSPKGYGSSLIMDALAWFTIGIRNAYNDPGWVYDAVKSFNYYEKYRNKKAAGLIGLECLQICKKIKSHLINKLSTETMFYTLDTQNSISLESIDPEKYDKKPIISVFSLPKSKEPPYYFNCFILDPSLNRHTSPFINGMKAYFKENKDDPSGMYKDNSIIIKNTNPKTKSMCESFIAKSKQFSKVYLVCVCFALSFLLIIVLNLCFSCIAILK